MDATAGTISIDVGDPGKTILYVKPTQDGLNGCDVKGEGYLTVSIASNDEDVATVTSAEEIRFDECGSENGVEVSVLGVKAGEATVSLVFVASNVSSGVFDLAPATFRVVVSKPVVEEPKDTTAPTITLVEWAPAANDAGWNNSGPVKLKWTCVDEEGGSGAIAGVIEKEVSAEGVTVVEAVCADKAGNSVSETRTVKLDLTAPGVQWNGGPEDGSSHYFGFVPAAPTCTAIDFLSGENGCQVTGYSTAVGPHTMTATAKDLADNQTVETRSYSVKAWTISGFKSPVDMGGAWNSVKGGSTVPLKFEVFAGDTELTDTAVVASFRTTLVTCDAGSATAEPVNIETTGKTTLRYDATEGQFIQNWQTPKNPGACYKVTATTLDGSSAVALFKLR